MSEQAGDRGNAFKDHFSKQAETYARYRPHYPEAIYAYLAGLAPNRDVAWDCATGSGQAALGLAAHFRRVIASDASAAQIAAAEPHAKVQYRVAPAEQTDIESGSVDLVSVAQALHWLDLEAFSAEARRVLRPRGVLAVWHYTHLQVEGDIDAIVRRYYDEVVGSYWPPERRLVEAGYAGLSLPGEEVATPDFAIEASWSREQLLGYLRSWSATQRYIDANGDDPLCQIDEPLATAWGDRPVRDIYWPLDLKVTVRL